MNKEMLENEINNGLSLREIAEKINKSLTTVRYWVKKYKISHNYRSFKQIGKIEYDEYRYCPKCEKNCLTTNFYKRRDKKNSSTYCIKCTNSHTLERVQNLKMQMVEYKGGCCQICGYDKYQGALEFHHLDPSKKDFNLSKLKVRKFGELVKNELDKCVMICSNCHREVHAGVTEIKKST